MMPKGFFLAMLLAAVASPVRADDCRPVDASRGKVSFEVEQAGAPFHGRFRRFGGEVCVADGRVTRVDVWLDPASVDAGLPEINAALKGDDFFAVDRYPRIEYSSRSVDQKPGERSAHGTLQVKGKSYSLEVPFKLKEEQGHPVVSGSLKLDRLEYGIGTGQWSNTQWLGAEVKVSFLATLP